MNPNQNPYTPQSRYQPPVQMYSSPQPSGRKRLLLKLIIVVVVLLVTGGIFFALFLGDKDKNGTDKSKTATEQATDAEQKTAASAMVAAVEKYASDNNGKYPATAGSLQAIVTDYSPSTGENIFLYKSAYSSADLPVAYDSMHYYAGHECDDDKAVSVKSSRSIAIVYKLSGNTFGCTNN